MAIAFGVWAIPGAIAFKAGRDFYFNGMKALLLAYLIEIVFGAATRSFAPAWLLLLVVGPLVEEAWRTIAISARPTSATSNWLAFGLGFGGLEATVKLLDLIAAHRPDPWIYLTPLAPLCLHVSLSLIAYLRFRSGRSFGKVLATTLPLHMWWNFCVYRVDRWPDASSGIEFGALCALLVLVTAGLCWFISRPKMTNPPLSASTNS